MLTGTKIKELFSLLNEALKNAGEIGEIGMVGGAVMCLVYNARQATRDIDAVFEPGNLIRKLVAKIGEEVGVGPNWLNDAAKGYIHGHFTKETVLNFSHLRIWAPEASYMLAMKCISARWDSSDRDDVIFLIHHLKLSSPQAVFNIIEEYYPKKQIPPKTQFFIEEVFERSISV